MTTRWRTLIVVAEPPERGARLASSTASGCPPHEVALLGARLLKLGAEVKVLDQRAESLPTRTIQREARWWKPDLTLVHAGGADLRDDPVPDARALEELLTRWSAPGELLLTGPLGRRYGAELLRRVPESSGVLRGLPSAALRELGEDPVAAGVLGRDAEAPAEVTLAPALEGVLPAWQLLPLDAYASRPEGGGAFTVAVDGHDVERDLAEVRHAVQRGRARFLHFETAEGPGDGRGLERVARRMFAAAPGIAWRCRLRSDLVDPTLALALFRGGCREVVLSARSSPEEPGSAPMDDPLRTRVEAAVDTLRATGISPQVEFVIGRPGHDRTQLGAWQRWFADRQIVVRPHVRLQHAGERGEGQPDLAAAYQGAGTWDNELKPRDVEKIVKTLGGAQAASARSAG